MSWSRRINWFGLAGGITTIIVVFVSMLYPWWQLTVGELFKTNASPVNTNFGLLGTAFTIPFIWALNVVSLLMLISSGIVMVIYSIIPTKTYSKDLLNFSYKKPLFSLVFFVVGLFAVILILQAVLSISVPLVGSATVTLPDSLTQGLSVSLFLSAGFQWPFWVGVVAASLCVAAKLYHKRIG
jgi:hypothetical protein